MKIGRNSKDKGYSLVELIIVISIMAVVGGVAALSISMVTNKKVTKCADEIASTLERARVLTLGKAQNDVEAVIYQDSATDNYMARIYQGGSIVSERQLGTSQLTVTVCFDGAESGTALSAVSGKSPAKEDPNDGLHVIFDRSSGAFVADTNTGGKYFTQITVTNGKKTVNITAVGRTGKISTN
jgi:prepilin-type N-terminal cleavage/methylation domain-containing protein